MTSAFVPERGDVIWLDFDPQVGHEQGGRRPAVVLSTKDYNERSGLAWVCPVTSRVKGYPFELELPAELAVHGVVLTDQVRCLDFRGRRASRIGTLPQDLCEKVRAYARRLLD